MPKKSAIHKRHAKGHNSKNVYHVGNDDLCAMFVDSLLHVQIQDHVELKFATGYFPEVWAKGMPSPPVSCSTLVRGCASSCPMTMDEAT